MRTLSLIPGASSTAMPMRLMLAEVAAFEVFLSLVLVLAGIAGLRILAGRVFAAGIMLYGKEPSWLDIVTWTVGRESYTLSGTEAANASCHSYDRTVVIKEDRPGTGCTSIQGQDEFQR